MTSRTARLYAKIASDRIAIPGWFDAKCLGGGRRFLFPIESHLKRGVLRSGLRGLESLEVAALEALMQEIHETDFEELVEKSASPVLVDFGATWCPPCKMLHPIVERIADEYAKQLAVYEVNTDKDPALARRFSITGVPTLIFFKEGQPVKNVVGFREYDALKAIVDSIL